MDQTGTNYQLHGGNLRIIGLSDLGQAQNPDVGIYDDDCYQEDRDNYIDITCPSDEAAARSITFVEIPSIEGGYKAFYNPGKPGPEPYPGIRHSAPGPPDLEPIILALDDPMRVSRNATTGVTWPLVGLVVVLAAAAALGIIAYRKRHRKQTNHSRTQGRSAARQGAKEGPAAPRPPCAHFWRPLDSSYRWLLSGR